MNSSAQAENPQSAFIAPAASRLESPSVLTDIYNDNCNMAIWQRSEKLRRTQGLLEYLESHYAIKISRSLTPENALSVMTEALPDFAGAKELACDISELVDMFCCLFDLKEAGLRLTSLDKAMCPRFHVDRVPCRLVTCYMGAGSQWLEHNDVDYSKLGIKLDGKTDLEMGLYESTDQIQQLNAGDVALLKGSGWIGNEQSGLIHRSPQGFGNQKRLLLTLDFLS